MPAATTERPTVHFAVRRVVVALDAQCDNRGALSTALEFAGRWRVGVSGVFVIGTDLLHLSRLPGVHQMSLTAGAAPLAGEDLEADIALLEGRARRSLAAAARQAGVEASFAVARGAFPAEAEAMSSDDLLVVEGVLRPFGGGFALENRWRRVAEQAPCPVLLIRRRGPGTGPVACFYDASEGADRGLAAALRLAGDRGQPLYILFPDAAADAVARLAPVLRDLRPQPRLVRLAGVADGVWVRTAAVFRPTLVVVPAGMPAGRWAPLGDADVLLIR
jgi:nucleotide-binding universal stress UspA family protein